MTAAEEAPTLAADDQIEVEAGRFIQRSNLIAILNRYEVLTPSPREGFVFMRHDDLPGQPVCEVPDALVSFHLSRGWTAADAPEPIPDPDPANDPPSGDNPATPED